MCYRSVSRHSIKKKQKKKNRNYYNYKNKLRGNKITTKNTKLAIIPTCPTNLYLYIQPMLM